MVRERGIYTVRFRDIPEAISEGERHDTVRSTARDALVTAIEFYVDDLRAVPLPSPRRVDEEWVDLPPTIALKVGLLNAMVADEEDPSGLAQRLGVTVREAINLLDPKQAAPLALMAAGFRVLGQEQAFQLYSQEPAGDETRLPR